MDLKTHVELLKYAVKDIKFQDRKPVDPKLLKEYQSLVGALLYCATNTRPDVAYSVGLLCRGMSYPDVKLLAMAHRVLEYLYHTRHLGLRYSATPRAVYGMSDSDMGRTALYLRLRVHALRSSHFLVIQAASQCRPLIV